MKGSQHAFFYPRKALDEKNPNLTCKFVFGNFKPSPLGLIPKNATIAVIIGRVAFFIGFLAPNGEKGLKFPKTILKLEF